MADDTIKIILGRELLDSKGRPMIEVEVECEGGAIGRAAAPCGTSVGSYEAFVLRDGGERYDGLGTQKAAGHVENIIAPRLKGQPAGNQMAIDELLIDLDGTADKSRLGGNTLYSTSVAVARAAAAAKNIPLFKHLKKSDSYRLPLPMLNVINGGRYGDVSCGVQEFLLIPVAAETFSNAYRQSVEIFYAIKKIIVAKIGRDRLFLGNSLGHAAPFTETGKNIELLLSAIEAAGYKDCFEIGLDCAASEFYDPDQKRYSLDGRTFDREELGEHWISLIEKYDLRFVEDPFHEDDFEAHADLTQKTDILITGDDLLVTNSGRLKKAVELGSCNSIIFKPNMIGTVSEALQAAQMAMENNYKVVPSIRSGGGVDDPIADFAVAVGAKLIKCGAPRSGERIVVQNRFLRLEENY